MEFDKLPEKCHYCVDMHRMFVLGICSKEECDKLAEMCLKKLKEQQKK